MSFGRIFFFIFGFALLEVIVLAQVAGMIGWPVTIIATVTTALLGNFLRRRGLDTWIRLNQKMQQGDMPGQEMVEGIMLLLGKRPTDHPRVYYRRSRFCPAVANLPPADGPPDHRQRHTSGFATQRQGGFTATAYTQHSGQPFQQPADRNDSHVTIDGAVATPG